VLEEKDKIKKMDVAVVLVTYDEPALLNEKMMHALEIPFPLLFDPTKETYRRWGLGRTNLMGAMLSPSLNVRYVKLLLKGERFLGFAPDMFQLGADFVVDGRGRIAFAHAMTNNGDRATVEQIMDELRRLANAAAAG